MQRGEVAGRPETSGLQPIDTDVSTGGNRVGKDQLLEFGVKPGPGHHVGGRRRADVFGELGEAAMILGGEEPLFDA
jgi:hypothetical protein